MQLFILYESVQGYCLFKKEEYDETGGKLSKVQKAIADVERFSKMVKLEAMSPFATAEEALENIEAIGEGKVSPMLQKFLTQNLPATKSAKKQKFALGISDTRLGKNLFEQTGITASYNDTITELIRGIRVHFTKITKSKYSFPKHYKIDLLIILCIRDLSRRCEEGLARFRTFFLPQQGIRGCEQG